MSDRYSKLFALSENLYSAGAPVVIAAGALQKDNQTGKVFAQLKIRNIQDKVIKASTVKIATFDTVGKPLGGTVDYQYLDLAADRDTDFGQKTPVILKEAATRSFAVSVSEVIFSDNSIWTAPDEAWEPLSAPVTPEKEFTDVELAKQYRVKYGADCKCVFKKEKDLWRCACGAVNHASEKNCHSCQREAAALAALNVEELKADRDRRLAAEQKKAAEEKAAAEQKKAAEEKAAAEQAKKTKKIAMIAAPIIVVAIVAAVLISNFIKTQQEEAARLDTYNAAVALAEAGQYDEAIAAFAELGDYKDSAEWANQNVAYEKVLFLLDCAERGDDAGLKISTQTKPKVEAAPGQNQAGGEAAEEQEIPDTVKAECAQKAITILEAIGNFKDSATLLERAEALLEAEIDAKRESDYEAALKYLNEGDTYSAYYIFEELGDYKDSANKMTDALIQNNLDFFSSAGKNGEQALGYFSENRQNYPLLSSEEITSIIVNDWVVRSCYTASYGYSKLTLYSDGTGSISSEATVRPYWFVSGNEFYYETYVPASFELSKLTASYNAYELRRVTDGLYMAFDYRDNPEYIFAESTSEWARRLILTAEKWRENDKK